jgi:hypothetical protein
VCELDLTGSKQSSVADFDEHDNELSDSIKWLSDYEFLKKDSTPELIYS